MVTASLAPVLSDTVFLKTVSIIKYSLLSYMTVPLCTLTDTHARTRTHTHLVLNNTLWFTFHTLNTITCSACCSMCLSYSQCLRLFIAVVHPSMLNVCSLGSVCFYKGFFCLCALGCFFWALMRLRSQTFSQSNLFMKSSTATHFLSIREGLYWVIGSEPCPVNGRKTNQVYSDQ